MPVPIPGRAAEALRRSTVVIRSGRNGMGSGVALHDGLVITNAHVVRGSQLSIESWEGRPARAKLVRMDRERDLALLEASGLDANAAQLGDSDLARPGMPVIAIGNPLGFTGAMSSGVIHSTGLGGHYSWLCADIHLAPGNSGGPLANFSGQVIGINTMVISGGLALAVPSRSVQAFVEHSNGRRSESRPQLGVTIRPISAGLLILEIVSGGAAEHASLLPGDVLVSANERPLRSVEDLELAIRATELVTFGFMRGGEARVRRAVVRLPQPRAATAA